MKKNKLLICALFMSLVVTALPGMRSYAADGTGGEAAGSELQDENEERLESVTAMDEDGEIYQVGETDGTVTETEAEPDDNQEADSQMPKNGIALFSARMASPVTMKVVNFNTKGNATTDFTYSGGSGYTNGNYGADAAYLGTDGSGNIRFMLAGVTGTVAKSQVQVLDYASVADNVSYYQVSGGKLIHYISYNLNSAPASSVSNGPAPSYLSEGTKYYSYDGHYFYTDYKTMLTDYQNEANGSSAVNSGNPFSNYFQFLNMNSSTRYSGDQLNAILSAKISNSASKLLGTGTLFVKYQDMYSVNALLSLGIAVNESGWGTSSICMSKNNLFGLNAVDQSPGQSANYFSSVEECIREFMSDWMADGYLSSTDWRNHGEFLGNKAEGINVSYASDPYWGEKAAAIAWELDSAGGSCDYLGATPDDQGNTEGNQPDTPPADTPDSTQPSTPSQDEQVTEPGDTNQPGNTDQPGNTSQPDDTNQPGNTSQPGNTDQQGNTSQPEDTNQPEDTVKPEDTDQSGDTSQSGDKVQSDNTAQTDDTVQPADTGKPKDTGKGAATEPEDKKEPVDSVSERNLVNQDYGIRVDGTLSGDAALAIKAVEPGTEAYNTYVSAETVKGKTILGVYDITLTGTMDGKARLTFQVGSEYNGRSVIILHYSDDGSYDTYKTVVENGCAVIRTDGFSPYVIALDSENAGNPAPQTGDTGNPAVWVAVMGLSAVLAMVVLLRRKKLR